MRTRTGRILVALVAMIPLLAPACDDGADGPRTASKFRIGYAETDITPPVGTVLNAVAGVGKVSMDEVTKGVVPFMIAQFALMFLMVLFPQLVMVPARWFY